LIEKRLIIPEYIDIKQEIGFKEEDEYCTFRNEYKTVFQNLFTVNCLIDFIFSLLYENINQIKSNNLKKIHGVELPLFLINSLYETKLMKNPNDTSPLKKLFFYALEINFMAFESEVIIIQYHDMLTKYLQFYICDENYLKIVIDIYLGDRGILYPNIKLASKISGILVKFIEKTKLNLKPFAIDVIVKIKNILDNLVDCKNFNVIFNLL
jgi:hypothetical protein